MMFTTSTCWLSGRENTWLLTLSYLVLDSSAQTFTLTVHCSTQEYDQDKQYYDNIKEILENVIVSLSKYILTKSSQLLPMLDGNVFR